MSTSPEDYRAVLGSNVAALDLLFGEGYELVCASDRAETVEIDILTAWATCSTRAWTYRGHLGQVELALAQLQVGVIQMERGWNKQKLPRSTRGFPASSVDDSSRVAGKLVTRRSAL